MSAIVNVEGHSELCRYNGSGGLEVLSSFNEGGFIFSRAVRDLTAFDDILFMVASTFTTGEEPYWYDGTSKPRLLVDFAPGISSTEASILLSAHLQLFVLNQTPGSNLFNLYRIRARNSSSIVPNAPEPIE